MFITEITTQPVNPTTVIALELAILSCSASVDDATYSWHRVGGSVPPRSIGQDNSTLTIPRVTPYDEGMYYCVAKKEEITVESNKARLNVDGKELK